MKAYFKAFTKKIRAKTKKVLLGLSLVTTLSGCGTLHNQYKNTLRDDTAQKPESEIFVEQPKTFSKYQSTNDILGEIAVKLITDIHRGNRDYHSAKTEVEYMLAVLDEKIKNGDVLALNSRCCKGLKGYENSSIGALVGILSEWKLHTADNPKLVEFLKSVVTDRNFKSSEIQKTEGLYISIYDFEGVKPEKILSEAMQCNPLPEYCDAICGQTTGLIREADNYRERLTAAFAADNDKQNKTADFNTERKTISTVSQQDAKNHKNLSSVPVQKHQKIWNKFYDNAVEMMTSLPKKKQLYSQINKQLSKNIFKLPAEISKEKLAYSYVMYFEYGIKSSLKNALSSSDKLSEHQQQKLIAEVYAVGEKGEGLKNLSEQMYGKKLSSFSHFDNARSKLKNNHLNNLQDINKIKGKEIKNLKDLMRLKKLNSRQS